MSNENEINIKENEGSSRSSLSEQHSGERSSSSHGHSKHHRSRNVHRSHSEHSGHRRHSHGSGSHSHGEHRSRKNDDSDYSKKDFKLFSGENFDDSSDETAEMERNGENVIYRYMRRQKVIDLIKRSIFCLFLLIVVIVIFSIAIGSEPGQGLSGTLNNNNNKTTVEEMEKQIYEMKEYIYELETQLSEYVEIEHRDF